MDGCRAPHSPGLEYFCAGVWLCSEGSLGQLQPCPKERGTSVHRNPSGPKHCVLVEALGASGGCWDLPDEGRKDGERREVTEKKPV